MSTLAISHGRPEVDAVVAAATAGDEIAFSELVSRHRNELQGHAYRMLGSHEDSEDLTQETFLRAWHRRETFRGDSSFRAWLYRIATNACLTALERRTRRVRTKDGPVVARQLGDRVLEEIAATDPEPDAEVAARETMELVVLVAVRQLPPKQRAVLFLRDVLGWSTKETAELLDTSPGSVTGALQRARAKLRRELPEHPLERAPQREPTVSEQRLLRRCLAAAECGDAQAFAAMLRDRPRSSASPSVRGGGG